MTGSVSLVGAGPGHPGLLTVRARECLERATVIVHDRLIPLEVLELAPSSARRIYVGKGPREHAVPQDGINDLLVQLGSAGERVVRLKGGDPFVFGRGGEEALSLRQHGIPFEIVPGVSSAIAVPAFAGIPVTHRGIAASFTVLTGHEDPSKPESAHHWPEIANGADTLIVLMGVEQMGEIVDRLLACGRPADQPAAIVQWGTTPRQVTVSGTLNTIVAKAQSQSVKPPAILIVGEVAALRDELSWFDRLPLFGLRILVTRSREQSSTLVQRLREQGAAPIELPAIDIQPVDDLAALDATMEALDTLDWIIFTSANGVRATMDRMVSTGRDARNLAGVRICAIGPVTARALQRYGLRADLIPEKFISTEIVRAFSELDIKGARLALFRSDIAPDAIVADLRALGASVESITSYQTVPVEHRAKELRDLLDHDAIDVLTFTSSSTVRNFLSAAGDERRQLAQRIPCVCIGPVTANAAREQGLQVAAVATEYTVDGLLATLVEWRSSLQNQEEKQ
ncbi:MAG: uroporphyrinogen-III C-methyltransferase [Chloroflexota bacterium]